MTTLAYLTLTDGTLVDFEQESTEGLLTVRAGRSLDPAERPVVLTLTPEDARQLVLRLDGFIDTYLAHLPGRWHTLIPHTDD